MMISPNSWAAERAQMHAEIAAQVAVDPVAEMRARQNGLSRSVTFGKSQGDYLAATVMLDEAERLFFAVMTYVDAVEAQGHKGFFNSEAGVVWQDAYRGLRLCGALSHANILLGASLRAGGEPPLDLEQRRKMMANLTPRFDDLDKQFAKKSPLAAVWRKFGGAGLAKVAA